MINLIYRLSILLLLLLGLASYSFANSDESLDTKNYKKRKGMIILVEPDFNEGNSELKGKNIYLVRYIKELHSQEATSQYLLCELSEPIIVDNNKISYLVIGGRFVGNYIKKDIINLPINIAFVIDDKLINEENMDFSKGKFVGIGVASDKTEEFYRN